MKHCKTGRQFGRVRSQRKALMSSLLSSLIIHGRIETTEAKAKEAKNAIDKVITKAKRANGNKMETTRKLESELSKGALTKLMQNMEKFDNRDSGYARVIKLSPRKSDSAKMAILELVDLSENKGRKKVTAKKAKKVDEARVTESKKIEEVKKEKDVDDEKSSK